MCARTIVVILHLLGDREQLFRAAPLVGRQMIEVKLAEFAFGLRILLRLQVGDRGFQMAADRGIHNGAGLGLLAATVLIGEGSLRRPTQ